MLIEFVESGGAFDEMQSQCVKYLMRKNYFLSEAREVFELNRTKGLFCFRRRTGAAV